MASIVADHLTQQANVSMQMKSNDQISIDEPNMHALDTTTNTSNYRDTAVVYLDKFLFSQEMVIILVNHILDTQWPVTLSKHIHANYDP